MNDVIVTTGTKFEIALAPEFSTLKTAALEESKGIVSVKDDFEQQLAVDSMKRIKTLTKGVEDSRTAAKKPALDFGRQIDDMAKKAVRDLEAEHGRIQSLVVVREAEKIRLARIEEEKRQEEERKRQAEQRRIEEEARKKQEELERKAREANSAKARAEAEKRLAEQKASEAKRQADEEERLRNQPVKIEPTKTDGQVTREVWVHEVTDIHALYAFDRSLVRMEAHTSAINVKIGGGAREIPGLVIRKEVKVGTR